MSQYKSEPSSFQCIQQYFCYIRGALYICIYKLKLMIESTGMSPPICYVKNLCITIFFKKKGLFWSSLVVQWVKDLAFSLLWLGSLFCCKFDFWPGTSLPQGCTPPHQKKNYGLYFSKIIWKAMEVYICITESLCCTANVIATF